MDKMRMESLDMTAQNIEKIEALFPNCITEMLDEEKSTPEKKVYKKAINFELLKQMLSSDVIEGSEAYEFTWVGKKAAIVEANKPIRKTLRPCKEDSVNWDTTENLYIEGDNLDVLKLLQESYLGAVKMIYIDPPYNTGNDFIYRDNFRQSADEYEDELGVCDEDGNRMFKNTDSNGRFHSDWCTMIYSRLMLARNLLSEDGVIFISIDDNEYENQKRICDEIFGASGFIATIVRNTNSSKNQSLFVSVSHEYCLVYAKNIEVLKIKHKDNKWGVPKNNVDEYVAKVRQLQKQGLTPDEITEELKSLTKYPRFIDFTNYWYFDEKGLYSKGDLGGVPNGNKMPVFNPITQEYDPVPPGGFRFNAEKMEQLTKEGKIHFHTDGSLPRIKRYLSENMDQRPKSIMSDDQRPDSSMMQAFNTPFDNPKQLSFMKRICGIMDNDALFLDFFSGSATTAHAVMELNAEDNGNRRFIMIQIPEKIEENSDAYEAGYRNICQVGEERIRRASKKIKEENPLITQNLDTGFRVLKLDETNMTDVYYSADEYSQGMLSMLESNVKAGRTDLDLLFGCLLEWGLPLSLPYISEDIEGCTVHTYGINNDDLKTILSEVESGIETINRIPLIACFDENIPDNVIKTIAKRQPLRAVFRDSSFASSPSKINVGEVFKLLAPDTRVKVI